MKIVVINSIVTQKYLVLHYYTMSLQRIRIIVGDAGFEPGTSASEVWCATNEPPYLRKHECRLSFKSNDVNKI